MDLEFENWFADHVSDSGIAPEHDACKMAWDAAKKVGYLEAVRNHDNSKVHGYCGDCICDGSAREQEDWAHVG